MKWIIMNFLKKYNPEETELFLKAKFTIIITILVILATFATISYSIYINIVGNFLIVVQVVGAIIMIAALGMLLKGKYSIAIHTLFITTFAAIWIVLFSDVHSSPFARVNTIVLVIGLSAAMPIAFFKSRMPIVIYFFGNAALFLLFNYHIKDANLTFNEHMDYFFDSSVAMFFVFLISFNAFSINQEALLSLTKELQDRKKAEKDLLESKNQLSDHLKNTPVGALFWDLNYRITEWNPSAETIFGYAREEVMGKHASELILSGNEKGLVDTFFQDLLSGRGGKRSVNYNTTKNGRRILCEWYNTVIKNIDGVTIGAASLVNDISEKQKIQETLKRNELRYRHLFDSAPVMYVILEDREGFPIITDCNRLFLTALGYGRAEVIGRNISEFYTPDSQRKMMKERNFYRIREKMPAISDRDLVTRDGEIIHVLLHGEPEYNEDDSSIGARCVFINITSQKRAEAQLKENHELLLMIVDGISDPLVMVDKEMYVIMMNAAAEYYFGKTAVNCLSQKCHQVFNESLSPCEGCKVPMVVNTGRKDSFERRGLMAPEKLEEISVYPVLDKNHHAWAAIIRINDISRQRQMEKELCQADKMISLGVLVSGVAHEINNPNNFIMLNTPVLWEAWKGIVPVIEKYYKENGDFSISGLPYSQMRDEIPQLFSGISNGASRIQRIVQDLKNFARQDDSDNDKSVNINQIIKESIRMTGNLIIKTTDHFKVEYGKHLPWIKGNKQKLEQVLINLIQNACQALPDKTKGIFISSSLMMNSGEIMIEVRDEGVGIPESLLGRIMDPFFTTKRREGGTGLGLAVSSNIIKSHGGRIIVASEVNKGAVFLVVLPITSPEKPVKIHTVDDVPAT
ncbi:MAG: PAS domain S-box protein [Pseudomonadota bacterium]